MLYAVQILKSLQATLRYWAKTKFNFKFMIIV